MANSEISSVKDNTAVQNQSDRQDGSLSKLAEDAYSGVGRELRLVGQGLVVGTLKEGYDAFAHNTRQTMVNLAGTVGLGAAIAVATKAGPLPFKLAGIAAGAYFGVQTAGWLKDDVFNGQRWGRIGAAVGDTWKSGANMDRNIATIQKDAGLLAFDSALMFGGGALGAKLGSTGVRLSSRIDMPGLKIGSKLVPELAPIPVERSRFLQTDVARVDPNDPFYKADRIVKPQKLSANGLEGLTQVLQESKMRELSAKDQVAGDLKNVRMPELIKQNIALGKQIDTLTTDLRGKQSELMQVDTLSKEKAAEASARSRVETLQEKAEGLGTQKGELKTLEEQIGQLREAAKKAAETPEDPAAKKAKPPAAKTDAPAVSIDDLKATARDLRTQIRETEAEVDTKNPESSLSRALKDHQTTKAALETATQARPGRIESIKQEIAGIQQQLETHRGTQAELGKQMQTLVDSYYTRLKGLMDGSQSVKPVPGASEVKEVATPPKQPKVKPVDTTGDATVAKAGSEQTAVKPGTVSDAAAGKAPVTAKDGAPVEEVRKDGQKEVQQRAVSAEEMERLETAGKAKVALGTAEANVNEAVKRLEALERATKAQKQARSDFQSVSTELTDIEKGKKTFADETAKQKAIEELTARQERARTQITEAQNAVKAVGSGQYFQAMKSVQRYASLVEDYYAREPNATARDKYAKEAVAKLETMLDSLPNSRNGLDRSKNLPKRGISGKEMERTTAIREHLEERLAQINTKHDQKLGKVAEIPAVKEAFGRVTTGDGIQGLRDHIRESLQASQERIASGPKPSGVADGAWRAIQARIAKVDIEQLAANDANVQAVRNNSSVVFFDGQGKLIGQVGTDGKFRPKYFDVPAIEKGLGRGGAGIDRLIGEEPVGYAVIAPKTRMSFGGNFELLKIPNTNTKGQPIFNKEVVAVGGTVPEGVEAGTAVNKLMPSRPATPAGDKKVKGR